MNTPPDMRQPARRTLATRRKGQGIVEFALVFPILIVTILAMVEFGLYLKDSLGLRYATLNASRTIAAQGANGADDVSALTSISNVGLLSLIITNVDYVEVYDATSIADDCPFVPADNGPGNCIAGQASSYPAVAPVGMRYSWQYNSTLQAYTWMSDSHGSNNWPPNKRNDVIPTDITGVYIKYHHYWADPFMHDISGGGIYMNVRSIQPIEPACYSSDAAFCRSQH